MDNKMISNSNSFSWNSIDKFSSPLEYEKFAKWINEECARGNAKEVTVKKNYLDSNLFNEKWFMHEKKKKLWRLVAPTFPFKGIFEEIPQ